MVEKKIIRIARDGKIEESALPDGYSETVFPKNGTWKKLGDDTINDQPAVKYSVSDASRTSYFWLSPDGKTPLRHEEGEMVIDFSNYSPGPQDPKLFQVPSN